MWLRRFAAAAAIAAVVAVAASACSDDTDSLEVPADAAAESPVDRNVSGESGQSHPIERPMRTEASQPPPGAASGCNTPVQPELWTVAAAHALINVELLVARELFMSDSASDSLNAPDGALADLMGELRRSAWRISGLRRSLDAVLPRLPLNITTDLVAPQRLSSDLYELETTMHWFGVASPPRPQSLPAVNAADLLAIIDHRLNDIAAAMDYWVAAFGDSCSSERDGVSELNYRYDTARRNATLYATILEGAVARSCVAFDCFGGDGDYWRDGRLGDESLIVLVAARREMQALPWLNRAAISEIGDQCPVRRRALADAVRPVHSLLLMWDLRVKSIQDGEPRPSSFGLETLFAAINTYRLIIAVSLPEWC